MTEVREPVAGRSEDETGAGGDGWRALFEARRLAAVTVLAGGVALYATNEYVTAALLPSAVEELGGDRFYAWVTTAFLSASVVSAMLVPRALLLWGARRAYAVAFGIFALGSLINAVAPAMEIIVAGRAVQGFGGGLLSGLGYAVIRSALPAPLWARATALVSAMWAVGNLLGPSLGGVFAELGWWRAAFAVMIALPLALAVIARRVLPAAPVTGGERPRLPVTALILLTAAAALFSVTAVLPRGIATVAGLAAGIGLLIAFVLVERRSATSVLPRLTYRAGNPLKWVYLTLAALSGVAMVEAFLPLFGQRLGGLTPVVAGFFGAALAVGWIAGQLTSVGITTAPARRRAVVAGALTLTAAMTGYGMLQAEFASGPRILGWVALLFLAGVSIGFAFPHLSVAAMSSTDDEAEAGKAAAGISVTQLIANAIASALAGVLVNLGSPVLLDSARYLAFGLAAIAAAGAVTATLSQRRRDDRRYIARR
ncbi:MFS transporter [Nocardia sp. NPDC057668]|uniref:MFS transporter n=1 Tax=Nocardia sp. NPDC057668 TaxID=3346202 RepID=UPI003670D4F8